MIYASVFSEKISSASSGREMGIFAMKTPFLSPTETVRGKADGNMFFGENRYISMNMRSVFLKAED
mgnify:CR=1 FL=1